MRTGALEDTLRVLMSSQVRLAHHTRLVLLCVFDFDAFL